MKNKKRVLFILGMIQAILWIACSKEDNYKKYLPQKPGVYPGRADSLEVYPGNKRVMLSWLLIADPTITRATIFWNNRSDSASVNINRSSGIDTVKLIIDQLQETSYTFELFTYDGEGNRSMPAVITGKAFGLKYQQTLLNRVVQNVNYNANGKLLTIDWSVPDTVNVSTQIWYTDVNSEDKTVTIGADENITVIPWLVGSKIYYQSVYKPTASAIDSFVVLAKDSIIVKYVPVPKIAWKKVDLPYDIAANAWGTDLSWIWNGAAGGYPEIYHNHNSGGMPHHFTIDMGDLYSLNKVEETGRTDCDCHNVTKFEVWGIADTTGAATTIPGDDPGWKDESVTKGWTLLKEVTRTDDGTVPYATDLIENTLPVRFIRIRVIKTRDESIESHMSEISFWYKP